MGEIRISQEGQSVAEPGSSELGETGSPGPSGQPAAPPIMSCVGSVKRHMKQRRGPHVTVLLVKRYMAAEVRVAPVLQARRPSQPAQGLLHHQVAGGIRAEAQATRGNHRAREEAREQGRRAGV